MLLFSHWLVLAMVTIYDHNQKVNPYQLQVYLLCIINIGLM